MTMNHRLKLTSLAAALIVCVASPLLLHADEGMWTFNNFPSRAVGQKYGFAPSRHDVASAIAGKTGSAASAALNAEEAQLQERCGTDAGTLCEVVSLYEGGRYDLYHYRRFNDVRLVFAPEMSVAQFGGDPDNFNFPRFDFDIGLVRVYDNGRPASSPDYLQWSESGSTPGELVFVSGNPGGTSRQLTTAQLAFERDTRLPAYIASVSEYRGLLERFVAESPEHAREGNENLFFVENAFKVFFGQEQALLDPQLFATKVREEQHLRRAVEANPTLTADRSAWDDIGRIEKTEAQMFEAESARNLFQHSSLLQDAVTLVAAANQRALPDGERLPEYTDQALVAVQRDIAASVPVYKDLEELEVRWILSAARRQLGVDDPLVAKMLGRDSPEQLAHALVSGTHLDEAKVRQDLYSGGQSAIDASTDPMIVFVRRIEPDFLALRKKADANVDAPTRAAAERIARARFAMYGTSIYPDATFTLRLSYGTVKGFTDARGRAVSPYTTIAGLFDRATGAAPFALPESWLKAKSSLNLSTPMNLSTTNDVIGGNSGSPLIDKDGCIVGLIFDGNIYSIGGNYGYDAVRNRSVAVDSRALLDGLNHVYHLDRIVDEIESARKR